jgi:hypothetical protein
MSDRHEPGTLIGKSPGIRTPVSKERALVFTLSFFSDSSDAAETQFHDFH